MTPGRKLFLTLTSGLLPLVALLALSQPAGHGADFTGVYNNTGRPNSGFGGPVGPCTQNMDENQPCSTSDYPYNARGRNSTISVFDDGSVQCDPGGLIRMSTQGLYSIQFWHEPETVKIQYEYGGIVRTIHLGSEPAPVGTPHSPEGYSVGQWRGNILHVETTHLTPSYATYIGGRQATERGGPNSDQARITERYWLSPDDEGALMAELVLDDPVNYTKPFIWSRRKLLQVPSVDNVDAWDCVDATDILLNEDPDLDAFFND